ncbi:phage portal protein, partial [Loigolactobacillus coryniformis]|uniref:phage portal protein n=1 Tax=Loigolactobacillus coryniformis TaxID=1610 RepID=UPI00201A36A7
SRTYKLRVSSDSEFVSVPANRIWHIKYLSWNGVVGLDVVDKVRESIGLALSAEEHGARFYANGAQVNGLLSTDASLGPEKAK